MNSSKLELIFHPFFLTGLIFIMELLLFCAIYRDLIAYNRTICTVCKKKIDNETICIFSRKGKIYRVHNGDCANIFLYGEEFYGKRFVEGINHG